MSLIGSSKKHIVCVNLFPFYDDVASDNCRSCHCLFKKLENGETCLIKLRQETDVSVQMYSFLKVKLLQSLKKKTRPDL